MTLTSIQVSWDFTLFSWVNNSRDFEESWALSSSTRPGLIDPDEYNAILRNFDSYLPNDTS